MYVISCIFLEIFQYFFLLFVLIVVAAIVAAVSTFASVSVGFVFMLGQSMEEIPVKLPVKRRKTITIQLYHPSMCAT